MTFNKKPKVSTMPQQCTAFTLAEVLITLLIIGIIAALTIPQLMNAIQGMQFRQAAKEAYSKLSQAIQDVKNDNGGSFTNSYPGGNTLRPVLITHFKVLNDCAVNACVASTDKTLTGGSGVMFNTNQFITTDGMFFYVTGTTYYNVAVDVNGSNGPNAYGRDIFMFEILNDKLVPEGANGTTYSSTNYCASSKSGAYAGSSYQGLGCMGDVMNGVSY